MVHRRQVKRLWRTVAKLSLRVEEPVRPSPKCVLMSRESSESSALLTYRGPIIRWSTQGEVCPHVRCSVDGVEPGYGGKRGQFLGQGVAW